MLERRLVFIINQRKSRLFIILILTILVGYIDLFKQYNRPSNSTHDTFSVSKAILMVGVFTNNVLLSEVGVFTNLNKN